MSNHQVEIKYMIRKLQEWNQELGGSQAKRSLANSEFDFLQEEFLTKNHLVAKCQDRRDKEGVNTANAQLGYQIRDGIEKMQQLVGKMREEHRRITKKKKEPADVIERKGRIVQNCELLLKDAEEREQDGMPKYKHKMTTLTDMRAKLLEKIDVDTAAIHQTGSDGGLAEVNEAERRQLQKWDKKDKQMDIMVEDITAGVKRVRKQVGLINDGQDQLQRKQKPVEEKIDTVSARIKKDNDQLKQIIQQFKPNRCCLVICLFLLLAGLIVVVIKLLI